MVSSGCVVIVVSEGYTPTADDMATGYAQVRFAVVGGSVEAHEQNARAAIAEIERAAAEKALLEAAESLFMPMNGPAHYLEAGYAEELAQEYLRDRAQAYRRKEQQ